MPSRLARMHTAEHLLTAVMRKHFNAPRNLEFHLNEKKTKCDYAVPTPIGNQQISEIECLVNEQIKASLPVSYFNIARDEAEDYDLWKVPREVDKIRIVSIGDYDATPCRGEHVSVTSEIGAFQVSSYEIRENGRVRIRFVVR